jgi:hypothetical protein
MGIMNAYIFLFPAKMTLIGNGELSKPIAIFRFLEFSPFGQMTLSHSNHSKSQKSIKTPVTDRVLSHLDSHFPLNRGGRFSIRALNASKKSSLPKAWFNPRFS